MEKNEFENKLFRMTKPEVNQLKHQDMLSNAIANSKDKTVLSIWWLIIPFYILSMFFMKSFFMPNATLSSSIHELMTKQRVIAYLFFMITPIIFIIINIISVRKVYILSGSPKLLNLLKTVWFNILIIIFSIFILLIYLL